MTRAERILRRGESTPAERFHALRAVVTPARVRMLQALPYDLFLQTPYWRILTAYLRHTRRACNRCGLQHALQVHHRSYEHHGREHDHLDDLEVLCRDCHAHEHHLWNVPTASGAWQGAGELLPAAAARIAAMADTEVPT